MDIDNLQIKITAETKEAVQALNKLKNALKGIDQYSQSNSFAILASNIRAFTKACSSSIPEIERLGDALSKVASVQARKLQSVAKAIRNLSKEATEAATTALTISPRGAMTPYDASFASTARGGNASAEAAKNYEYEASALNALTVAEDDVRIHTSVLEEMFGKKNKTLKDQTKLTNADKEALRFLEKALRIVADVRLKQFKQRMDKSTKSVSLFNNSIMRVLKYRMIRSAIKAIGDAYKEGLGNLYQYSKTLETIDTSGNISQTLDQLSSTMLQLKNTLGVTFGYLAITLQPLITFMSDGLMKLAESINILLSDALGNTTFYKAKYNLKEYMEIAEKTRKANKGLIQSFDELHNITTGDDNSVNPADMFEQVEITKELKDEANKTILADIGKVAAAVAAYEGLKAIVKGVIGMFSKKNDALDTQTQKTGLETEAVGLLAGAFGLAAWFGKRLKDRLDELGEDKNPYPDPIPEPVIASMGELEDNTQGATEQIGALAKADEDLVKKWTPVPVVASDVVMVNLEDAEGAVDDLRIAQKNLVGQWEKPLPKIVSDSVATNIDNTKKKVNNLETSVTNAKKTFEKGVPKLVPNSVMTNIENATKKLNELAEAVERLSGTNVPTGQESLNPYGNMNVLGAANAYKSWNTQPQTDNSFLNSYEVRKMQQAENEAARNEFLKATGLDYFFSKEFEDAVAEGITNGLSDLNSVFKRLLGSGTSGFPSLVPGFASGGFPSAGSLFWAGETNAPELLGTVNGRTAVAGGVEITGIREAIYDVGAQMLSAMANESVTIEGDMSKFLRVLKKSQYNEGLRLGTV